MRHGKSGRKLNRDGAHRKAMFRNMVTSLLRHGRIRTTDQKAKELRRVAARMVTLGKKGTLHARRLAAKTINDPEVLQHLFDEIAPGYAERHGGYTRIVKIGRRRGDNALMSMIELMPAGAPETKAPRRRAAPAVRPSVAIPETKERFDEAAQEAPAEAEATEELAAAAEEAPATEEAPAVAEEAPATVEADAESAPADDEESA